MKLQTLKSIIEKKKNKSEFAIITNLKTGESEIFEKDKPLSKEMEVYSNQINEFFKSKKNGVIENSEIFVETYILPIKVIIVGAVHIAQYLVDFAESLNFEISIIDPRGYFASEQRFPNMKIINKWPFVDYFHIRKSLFRCKITSRINYRNFKIQTLCKIY